MTVSVISSALHGVDARLVRVEVNIRAMGLPGFHMVGLADTAVRESRVRVLTALEQAGYNLADRHVTVNLAPASLPKTGSSLDLAIAAALLAAAGHAPRGSLDGTMFVGELGLDGTVRPVRGVLPAALAARRGGLGGLVVPAANGTEASWVDGLDVRVARDFASVVQHLHGEELLEPARRPGDVHETSGLPELAHVRGQQTAKRALEVAAAGGHNVRLVGPPGSGKTMLARALAGVLPPLTDAEALETSVVYSVAGLLRDGGRIMRARPFRAPHHSTSYAGLVGGGSMPRPGEVSLAHNGVLFLDELPEFGAHTLDLLREPLEEGRVTVVRASGAVVFPARFLLVAAMNPCRCGHHGDGRRDCTCTISDVRRYQLRISGPLLDRIDMSIPVPSLSYHEITRRPDTESSATVRERVVRARDVQMHRWHERGLGRIPNSQVPGRWFTHERPEDPSVAALVEKVVEMMGVSARGYVRLMRVARTIADLDGVEDVEREHAAEAIQYCRGLWGESWHETTTRTEATAGR